MASLPPSPRGSSTAPSPATSGSQLPARGRGGAVAAGTCHQRQGAAWRRGDKGQGRLQPQAPGRVLVRCVALPRTHPPILSHSAGGWETEASAGSPPLPCLLGGSPVAATHGTWLVATSQSQSQPWGHASLPHPLGHPSCLPSPLDSAPRAPMMCLPQKVAPPHGTAQEKCPISPATGAPFRKAARLRPE